MKKERTSVFLCCTVLKKKKTQSLFDKFLYLPAWEASIFIL